VIIHALPQILKCAYLSIKSAFSGIKNAYSGRKRAGKIFVTKCVENFSFLCYKLYYEKDDIMTDIKQKRVLTVKMFSSFEEENRAEHRRLAALTPNQRLKEFAILQERVWGTGWTEDRIVKTVSIEKVTW